MKIKLQVTGQHLCKVGNYKLIRDSKKYIKLDFSFVGKYWDDCIKTVVFKTDDGKIGTKIMTSNLVKVPTECAASKSFKVSVFGEIRDTDMRITTNPVEIVLGASGYAEAGEFETPLPSVYEQILDNITQQNERIEALEQGGSSGGGTSDHSKLTNRDLENQHPISAIDGLQYELDICRKAECIVYEKGDIEADIPDKMSVQESIDLIFSVMGEMILFIPEKTSQLENDSGFVNAEYVTNAINSLFDETEPLEIELEAGGTLTFVFDDADNTFVKMYADTSAGINEGDTIADIEFMYKGNYVSIKDMYTVDGMPYFYNMGKTFEGDYGIFVGSIGFSSGFNDIIQSFYDYEELAIKIKYHSAE